MDNDLPTEAAASIQHDGAPLGTDEEKSRIAESIVQRLREAGIQCEIGGWLGTPLPNQPGCD
jgi:hypothetical protein